MNKRIFNFFFILLSTYSICQNSIYVEYETSLNALKTKSTLLIDKEGSVYEEGIQSEENPDEFAPNSFTIGKFKHLIIYQTIKTPNIIYLNFLKNDDRFSNIDKDVNIIDYLPKFSWNIVDSGESVELGGFKCEQAILDFRGSKFLVYYTNQIPAAFGPWKFNGLPGLILKIISLDNSLIYWEATKILYPYENPIKKDFRIEDYSIKFKDYVNTEDKLREDRIKTTSAKMGTPYKLIPNSIKRDKTRERKYEWETW